MQQLDFLRLAGGRVYVSARDPGNVSGVIVADANGIEPVLFTRALDGKAVVSTFLVDVSEQGVLVMSTFFDGSKAYYANVFPPGEAGVELEYNRNTPGSLQLTIPAGWQLDSTSALGTPWDPSPVEGQVQVPMDAPARFFRLRKP